MKRGKNGGHERAQPRRPEERAQIRVDYKQAVDYDISIDLHSAHNFYTGLTQNIGTGGLFIATTNPRPIGATLLVRFSLPGRNEAIHVVTQVRWLRERSSSHADAGSPGMGLMFMDLSPEATRAIEDFVRERDSLYHDVD